MASVAEIDRRIRELTHKNPQSRPFVCSGSPIGCSVAQIGINPGTPTPFWPHWSVTTGFDKQGWLADYVSREGKIKPTRRNIDYFSNALLPLRCIELNLYDRFSRAEGELERAFRHTEVLEYMLQAVKPRLVLVHGKRPAEHVSQFFGVQLVKEQFTPVTFQGVRMQVLQAKRHFSRGVGKEYVTELALRFRQHAAGEV